MSNFIYATLSKIAEAAFTEEKLDNAEEAVRRFEICKSNAKTCFNKKLGICRHCSCIMEVKTKLKTHREPWGGIRYTHCPLGLWGREDKIIANYYRDIDGKPQL